ncbi:hypothetical protein GCM10025331_55210 [Actinoplanes utahensis]
MAVPLRGRASLLTCGGTGLRGHGEVWAVQTDDTGTSLMIVYGRTESADDRQAGLCAAGQTITLSEVTFTWRTVVAPQARVPQPRTAITGVPRTLRLPPPRATNTRT